MKHSPNNTTKLAEVTEGLWESEFLVGICVMDKRGLTKRNGEDEFLWQEEHSCRQNSMCKSQKVRALLLRELNEILLFKISKHIKKKNHYHLFSHLFI